uniref:hypothetical protein n=1 Tax=Pedobacter schmidteae TaxID=2201271 RepID=UPI000EB44661|nr:hypothetical protein [Pedobacter schmidteae]
MKNTFAEDQPVSRRKILTALGIAGLSAASAPVLASTKNMQQAGKKESAGYYPQVSEMVADRSLKEGILVHTYGYHQAGDGGNGTYRIEKITDAAPAIAEGHIKLENGLVAMLVNVQTVNYKLFGAVGDGKNDDSVQIYAAHTYANRMGLPVHNFHGEYWLKKANNIEIMTNVDWGNTIFHIDETTNSARDGRFKVSPAAAPKAIVLSDAQKATFLNRLKPGVKVIPELAAYPNCLVMIQDKNDQIGFRAGEKFDGQSWAREELFYVEEHGSIIGDIAWQFKGYTSLMAYPVDNSYLTINGGTFYLSGDSPGNKYVRNGFSIIRSRTIIQNQWVGLEPGKKDVAMSPRTGFYSFTGVYDVKLENIRLIPYEQDREGTANDVPAGTYGIGGARILNALFRNVTAEGGPIHWGVFGTNLNKNFRVENCKLNRIDVHFHCWNLYIKDSGIGYRGISVTGGGELIIENTSCYSRSFINFRRDFGAKWDGDIRLRNCRFMPAAAAETAFLDFSPADFDYKYPLGFGRSIIVENLVVDFSAVPESKSACWLMKLAPFSKTKTGQRLFFPHLIEFKNVTVKGREKGLRLMEIGNPKHYQLDKPGGYDGAYLQANSSLLFDRVELENLETAESAKTEPVHLSIAAVKQDRYADGFALYPKIQLVNCNHVQARFGSNSLEARFESCSLSGIAGDEQGTMPGGFSFADCSFRPAVKTDKKVFYALASELGTSFTNCTLHVPRINGSSMPELFDRYGFVQFNKTVRYYHLNTRLGNDVLNYHKAKGTALKAGFIAMLKSHHQLEAENI